MKGLLITLAVLGIIGLVAVPMLRTSYGDYPDPVLSQAAEIARAEKKLLIVDATTSWCGPCQQMDQQTWPHASVQSWLDENAIFVQFDVDEVPSLAAMFEIRSLPTIIAIRNDREIDRIIGGRGPQGILEWFNKVN